MGSAGRVQACTPEAPPRPQAGNRNERAKRHAAEPGKRWSLDFASDVFKPGRRFRTLAVIDDCTRECLALVDDTSLLGRRVARKLGKLIRLYGTPAAIVSDNGTERTSRAILEWQNGTGG